MPEKKKKRKKKKTIAQRFDIGNSVDGRAIKKGLSIRWNTGVGRAARFR